MHSRKEVLIDALITHLQRNGLADLSLRPLAAEIGTSARLLIYHFGSKENLLAEVLEVMQARLRDSALKLTKAATEGDGKPPLRLFWNWATARKNFGYLKLLYELQILAAQNPAAYAQYLERNSSNWLDLVQAALPPSERTAAMATLLVAVFDGLFLELMSTGDRQRTTQALEEFISLVVKARECRSRD
ncbi:MAG: TetR/AcrR family transcriptional regulator [Gammaproteobacteria bacterium]